VPTVVLGQVIASVVKTRRGGPDTYQMLAQRI
jgi:hypothetical protein